MTSRGPILMKISREVSATNMMTLWKFHVLTIIQLKVIQDYKCRSSLDLWFKTHKNNGSVSKLIGTSNMNFLEE